MQKAFILNEEEYAQLQGQAKYIEQLQNENKTLREFNSKKSHALEQAKSSISLRDDRIRDLVEARQLDQKALAAKAHELLVKEAELAALSAKLQEAKRDCEGTSRVLKETQEISAKRLEAMDSLMRVIRRLKSERVCIVKNYKTATVKIVSATKADTYRKFGWAISEEYLVDRPA